MFLYLYRYRNNSLHSFLVYYIYNLQSLITFSVATNAIVLQQQSATNLFRPINFAFFFSIFLLRNLWKIDEIQNVIRSRSLFFTQVSRHVRPRLATHTGDKGFTIALSFSLAIFSVHLLPEYHQTRRFYYYWKKKKKMRGTIPPGA